MKPLLVGELNPYGPDPQFALWPDPPGCAGWRLCHVILGMEEREYLRAFDRANLCLGGWSLTAARSRADELVRERTAIVALGAKVASAFRVPFKPYRDFIRCLVGSHVAHIAVLPHPSGRCRLWNDQANVNRARQFVGSVLAACSKQEEVKP